MTDPLGTRPVPEPARSQSVEADAAVSAGSESRAPSTATRRVRPGWAWLDHAGWPWVTRLTLLYLLLKTIDDWWLRFPVLSICLAALVVPGWHRRTWTWWTLLPLLAINVLKDWSTADNHHWLLVYWILAMAIASRSPDPSRSIRISARALLALVFLFATLWKVGLSADYRSGDFMRVTILTDSRFADFTRIFTDVDDELAAQTRQRLAWARLREPTPTVVPLPETETSIRIAWASSWFIGLVEGWIGFAFLLGTLALLRDDRPPRRAGPARWLARSGDVALLFFAAITYPFATVVGFGWLLMILGLAQCEPEQRRMRAAYLLAAWLILLARYVPIVETAAGWL